MQANYWRNIIKFDFTTLFEINNLIPLILGIVGFVVIMILRIPEKKEKTTVSLSKFSFLLMNYLYLDALYHDKLIEDAGKLDQDRLYRFMIREINKTKDSPETNQKLLQLFQEFQLIEYCRTVYSKSNSDRKLKLMEDFALLPMQEISDLILPILSGNYPIPIKLAAIKTLTRHGLSQQPLQILLSLSQMPDTYNKEICDILFRVSQTHPNDSLANTSLIEPSMQPIFSNRFISLLFQPDSRECIAGAYMIGFLGVKSASRFLSERLMACEEKEPQITILKALRKVNDQDISDDLYQYLISHEKIDADIIRECLTTLTAFGLVGTRIIQKLTSSNKPLIKVMAKSFLSKS